MIAFRDFALRRGGRLLLANVNAVLHEGWKTGIVGRNGSGKSSLFAAILGGVEADSGSLDRPLDQRIASVAQETPPLPDAAIDYVLGGDVELAGALRDAAEAEARGDATAAARAHHHIDALGGYDGRARAGRLLYGLGFKAGDHDRPVAEFSGGWRARLNLARALMAPSDVLLLDEPTNHLDLDAVLWLEQWLRRYPGMLLVISHDREFLDGTVDHVLHLEQGGARLYTGNYSAFEHQRAEHLRQQQLAHEREQVERAHLQSYIDRFRYKATKARQAQSRMKRLEKLVGTEAVRAERGFEFNFAEPERLPQSMLQLEHVSAGYRLDGGGTREVIDDVRLRIEAGDRIGLLGPNGAGKSTLVKTMVGDLAPLAGERNAHKDLVIGYFAQHTVESLRDDESPYEHLHEVARDAAPQVLRDWLGRWNFAGERAFDPVRAFSGGERARLALALIAWHKPNLLLLDEPTNHLDLDMRSALADALNDYPGALVLVAHDRHLLGLVCDSFWRVADGRVEPFDGDLEDYAKWLRARGTGATGTVPVGAGSPDTNARVDPRERRRAAAANREQTRSLRREVDRIERRLAAIDAELTALTERLADPEIYAGPTAVLAEIGRDQSRLREEQAKLEAAWLAANETLEAQQA